MPAAFTRMRGHEIGQRGITLVFGGTHKGLMRSPPMPRWRQANETRGQLFGEFRRRDGKRPAMQLAHREAGRPRPTMPASTTVRS